MAVVFISPKRRQKMFFIGITILFLLFLSAISLGVFLAKPNDIVPVLTFNEPKVNIDMGIFDTDQFKNLQPLPGMQMQYNYQATSRDGKLKIGFVSASSFDEARTTLENQGLVVSQLKEVEPGRNNPFTPYAQPVTPPVAGTKTVKYALIKV